MRACTFISKFYLNVFLASIALISITFSGMNASGVALAAPNDRTQQSEEDDYKSTPYTEYGDFNEESEEAADIKFFQFGRFFGVSLGAGLDITTGNLARLYQPAPPLMNFKLHYWFDFNFALDMGFSNSKHYFDILDPIEHVDISLVNLGINIKYYLDTRNLSSTISYANPYVLGGYSGFSKTIKSTLVEGPTVKNSSAMNIGAGIELPIKHRRTYFTVEAKYYLVTFDDTFSHALEEATGVPDQSGRFIHVLGSVLFTW